MKKHIEVLQNVNLFDKINPLELEAILKCLGAITKSYHKGDIITLVGDNVTAIGIIVSGNVEIIKENFAGRKTILTFLGVGEIFGEVICFSAIKSPVSVVALTDTTVVFIDVNRLVTSCTNSCEFHTQLIQNMLMVISQKNFTLNNKINYLLIKGMREKLANYILEQNALHKSQTFNMAFDRNSLADFLNVDRSAMCRELGRMRDENIIEYYKSSIKILDIEKLKSYL